MFQLANAPMLPLVATELTKTSATWAVPLIGACIVLPQIIVALFAPWVGRSRKELAAVRFSSRRWRCCRSRRSPGLLQRRVPGRLHPESSMAFRPQCLALIPLVVADISYGTGHFNLAQGVIGMSIGLAAAISMTAAGYIADTFGHHAAFMTHAEQQGESALCCFCYSCPRPSPRMSNRRS